MKTRNLNLILVLGLTAAMTPDLLAQSATSTATTTEVTFNPATLWVRDWHLQSACAGVDDEKGSPECWERLQILAGVESCAAANVSNFSPSYYVADLYDGCWAAGVCGADNDRFGPTISGGGIAQRSLRLLIDTAGYEISSQFAKAAAKNCEVCRMRGRNLAGDIGSSAGELLDATTSCSLRYCPTGSDRVSDVCAAYCRGGSVDVDECGGSVEACESTCAGRRARFTRVGDQNKRLGTCPTGYQWVDETDYSSCNLSNLEYEVGGQTYHLSGHCNYATSYGASACFRSVTDNLGWRGCVRNGCPRTPNDGFECDFGIDGFRDCEHETVGGGRIHPLQALVVGDTLAQYPAAANWEEALWIPTYNVRRGEESATSTARGPLGDGGGDTERTSQQQSDDDGDGESEADAAWRTCYDEPSCREAARKVAEGQMFPAPGCEGEYGIQEVPGCVIAFAYTDPDNFSMRVGPSLVRLSPFGSDCTMVRNVACLRPEALQSGYQGNVSTTAGSLGGGSARDLYDYGSDDADSDGDGDDQDDDGPWRVGDIREVVEQDDRREEVRDATLVSELRDGNSAASAQRTSMIGALNALRRRLGSGGPGTGPGDGDGDDDMGTTTDEWFPLSEDDGFSTTDLAGLADARAAADRFLSGQITATTTDQFRRAPNRIGGSIIDEARDMKARAASQACVPFRIDLSASMGEEWVFSTDAHCRVMTEEISRNLASLMLALYSLMAGFVILRA